MIKLLELPGIQSLEDTALLYGVNSERFSKELVETCNKLFGAPPIEINRSDEKRRLGALNIQMRAEGQKRFVRLKTPDLPMAEDVVKHLKKLGYDLTGTNGQPLAITKAIALTVEFVAKGLMGKKPDVEAAAAERFGAGLADDLKRWKASRG